MLDWYSDVEIRRHDGTLSSETSWMRGRDGHLMCGLVVVPKRVLNAKMTC